MVSSSPQHSLTRTRTIVASVLGFGALSLVPKLLVVAKDMVVARHFGASFALDAYLMAFVLIGVPVAIVVVALQTTLIPALADKNDHAAAGLLGGVLKLALALLVLALPLWLLTLPYMLSALYPKTSESTRGLLLTACYWLIPYYFLNGINLLFYGALQARKVFWANALLPGMFPLVILVAVTLVNAADIHALLIGTALGSLGEGLALYAIIRRAHGFRWLATAGSGLLPVLQKALPLMAGGIVAAAAPIVEQMIAFRLGEGAVSLLNYGNKIPAAVSSLMVTGLGIVILPHFAELLAKREWRACQRLHTRFLLIALGTGSVVALLGAVLAEPIIRLLFERGAFTVEDSRTAATVMRAYLLQLPFLLAAMVSLRALIALGKTGIQTIIVAGQLLLGAGLAWELSQSGGVSGVALGTALATMAGCVVLFASASRQFAQQIRRA